MVRPASGGASRPCAGGTSSAGFSFRCGYPSLAALGCAAHRPADVFGGFPVLRIAVLHGATLRAPRRDRHAAHGRGGARRARPAGPRGRAGPSRPRTWRRSRRCRSRRPDLVFNLVEAIGGDAARGGRGAGAARPSGPPLYRLRRARDAGAACRSSRPSARSPRPACRRPPGRRTGSGLAAPAAGDRQGRHRARLAGHRRAARSSPAREAAAEVARRAERARHAASSPRTFVEGREFNLAVLAGPDGPQVLPLAETLFVGYPGDRPKIVDYEAKWAEDSFAYNNTPRRFDFGGGGHRAWSTS